MLGSQPDPVKWTQHPEKRGKLPFGSNSFECFQKALIDLPEATCSRTIHAPEGMGYFSPLELVWRQLCTRFLRVVASSTGLKKAKS